MSGTLALTAVIYAGTAQSLNGLAPDLLAHVTLYQLSFAFRFLRSVSSLHIVTGLQRLLSFPAVTRSFLPSIFTLSKTKNIPVNGKKEI